MDKKFKIYDVSMKITPEIWVYKNKEEKKVKIEQMSSIDVNGANETKIIIPSHTGTHIDMPLHMIKDGKNSSTYDIERMLNVKCKVLDLTHIEDKITKKDLEKFDDKIQKDDFILLKTRNSLIDEFDFNFVYLEKTGSEYLRDKKINGVGIDALGIEREQPDHITHINLLENDIIIMEGLRLKEVKEGEYKLLALPLQIDDIDAMFTRVILMEG